MTFLDIRQILLKNKAELNKELTYLAVKIDKSHTALHKEINDLDRKLDLVLQRLDSLEKKQAR